jgi:hypothetical protein
MQAILQAAAPSHEPPRRRSRAKQRHELAPLHSRLSQLGYMEAEISYSYSAEPTASSNGQAGGRTGPINVDIIIGTSSTMVEAVRQPIRTFWASIQSS